MGIGYGDSVIIYNRAPRGALEEEIFYGTRFNGVRAELTQGADILLSGPETADSCRVKIPLSGLPKPYLPPRKWRETEEKETAFTLREGVDFFAVVKKEALGLDQALPAGRIDGGGYPGGFYQYLKTAYGFVYRLCTVEFYQLLPRFELGGK